MRKIFLLMLSVVVFLSMLLPGQEQNSRLKVGLMKFSVKAFKKEKNMIHSSHNVLQVAIEKVLKKHFAFETNFSDEILYSNIVDPEVTIDPEVEPETNKRLEKLCGDDLDGVIFGHFYQEANLIVVSRFYFAKKFVDLPENERILSVEEIKIPTENLTKNSIKSQTVASIESLVDRINKKKQEFVQESGEASTTDNQSLPKTQPQKPQVPIKKSLPRRSETSQKSKNDCDTETLTFEDAYRMVSENGFYCEIVGGSPYHENGLKNIEGAPDNLFPLKRRIYSDDTKDGRISTFSKVNFECKECEGGIELIWNKKKLHNHSFSKAVEAVGQLNKKSKGTIWRLPTAMELLSIAKPDTFDHFPTEFQIYRRFPKMNLVFWTSTCFITEEGKNMRCTVESQYDKKRNLYWLHLGYRELNCKESALLLPVSSDTVYLYKKNNDLFETDKVPGFDGVNSSQTTSVPASNHPGAQKTQPSSQKNFTNSSLTTNDREPIPGFDDEPGKTGSTSLPLPPQLSHHCKRGRDKNKIFGRKSKEKARTVRITLFPYVWKGLNNNDEELCIDDLNNRIKEKLIDLSAELKANFHPKLELDIRKMDSFEDDDSERIERFYNLIPRNNNNLTLKVHDMIKRQFMGSSDTDIIITVKYSATNSFIDDEMIPDKKECFFPILFDGLNDHVFLPYSNEVCIQNHFYNPIVEEIVSSVDDIINNTFERKFN